MKTATEAGITAHLNTGDTTLATCIYLERQDGTIHRKTDHDRAIDVAGFTGDEAKFNGTYAAATGFTPTALESTAALSVDNLNLEAFFDSSEITTNDMIGGRINYAEMYIFLVNWQDPNQSHGIVRLKRSRIGEVRMKDQLYVAEARGMKQNYTRTIGHLFTPDCRVDLGDSKCGINLEPDVWQASTSYQPRNSYDASGGATAARAEQASPGSICRPSSYNDRHFRVFSATSASGGSEPTWVTTLGDPTTDGGVTWVAIRASTVEVTVNDTAGGAPADPTRSEFYVNYTGDAPDSFLTWGVCTFVDGDNAGIAREIEAWDLSEKKVTLFRSFPFDIAVSENVKLSAGCLKTVPVCRDIFDNIYNFRGHPYVPGQDRQFKTTISQHYG